MSSLPPVLRVRVHAVRNTRPSRARPPSTLSAPPVLCDRHQRPPPFSCNQLQRPPAVTCDPLAAFFVPSRGQRRSHLSISPTTSLARPRTKFSATCFAVPRPLSVVPPTLSQLASPAPKLPPSLLSSELTCTDCRALSTMSSFLFYGPRARPYLPTLSEDRPSNDQSIMLDIVRLGFFCPPPSVKIKRWIPEVSVEPAGPSTDRPATRRFDSTRRRRTHLTAIPSLQTSVVPIDC
jgi:hypothetical protein